MNLYITMYSLIHVSCTLKIQNMNETKYNFILSNKNGDSLNFGYDHKEKLFLTSLRRISKCHIRIIVESQMI